MSTFVEDPSKATEWPAPQVSSTPEGSAPGGSHSHRSSIIAGLAALVVLLGLLVIAAFVLTTDGPGSEQRVVFVGDSITDQSRTALAASMPADDTLDIQAVSGRKFAEMLPFATQAAQSHPDQVVINLGSNDVLLGERDDVTDQAMTSMFDAFRGTPCVAVVTVNEHFIFANDQGAHARRINDSLERQAAQRGYSVVDWNKMVEDYTAAGEVKGPITSDSVHPSEVGKQMLIDAVRGSLERCRVATTSKTT